MRIVGPVAEFRIRSRHGRMDIMIKHYETLFAAGFAVAAWIAPVQPAFAQTAPSETSEPVEPDATPDEAEPSETIAAAAKLLEIITVIDDDARLTANGASFTIDEVTITLVFDVIADRMRLFSQVVPSDTLSVRTLRWVMQANFDTALDARYALARGRLWATFIHPLSPLEKDQFISALGQTVNVALTYGTLYSGGAISFGGGDSIGIQRQLIEDLLRRGQEI